MFFKKMQKNYFSLVDFSNIFYFFCSGEGKGKWGGEGRGAGRVPAGNLGGRG